MKNIDYNKQTERWGIFELTLNGPEEGNPFIDVGIGAQFRYENRVIDVDGFYDGGGIYRVRFMPDKQGKWNFVTRSNCKELDDVQGTFECITTAGGHHGPVRVTNTWHFAYADGTPYVPAGTTCYAWIHQGDMQEAQTIKTLSTAPFNKLRMCVFPKDYDFNKNEPVYYPFEGSLESGWDFTRFNPAFFNHLEKCIGELMELGIEADLILFHPYDRWGFSRMPAAADDRYLKYVVARLAAYHNIWWSFANEFDFMENKKMEDWDRFFMLVQEKDPCEHLRSIHGCRYFYNYGKPWVTHCSIQCSSSDVSKVYDWRNTYKKPVVIDECGYEGNINHDWGNLTGQDMMNLIWTGFFRGGYVGHGETYMHPEDILWWSKGGVLHGTSPERIAFLRRIIEAGPPEGHTPFHGAWDVEYSGKQGEYYLYYFGSRQPSFREITLPRNECFNIDIIDCWEMTITPLTGTFSGKVRINLPAKQYIALRARRLR